MSNSHENLEFETLLDYVKHNRGFDVTGYKRSTLMRRVNRRMQTVGIEGYSNYLDYLQVHPEEFNHLFNTLLINVTSFFRDRSAWEYLTSEIIPRIAARKEAGEPIRVWSAGCASGEEAYTIAMAIAQAIGVEQFSDRVKIYATDVDQDALNQARQATYLARNMDGLTPEELEQFFERLDDRYTFRKELRRTVIFGRHDLMQDAPISKIDLLVCRNALMYFNAETQSRILARFHFALRDNGFLFLGKAEMLLPHSQSFTPVHLKCRVFSKVPKLNLRDRLLLMAQTNGEEVVNYFSSDVRLREIAFDSGSLARIIVNANGSVVLINERARLLFNLNSRDVGRPLHDFEISYRPVELRSCIDVVYKEHRTINHKEIEWQTSLGETIYLDVEVSPLFDMGNIVGISIDFTDVTRYKRLKEELENSNQELEMAYEELQSTNEELETTNEELQSSNEELETTNEELQATNEELETINEELQSTNEELQTLNDELERRSEELNHSNAFLECILKSLQAGVVVVDRNVRVQVWNHKAEDLWGLRTEEALGQNFLNLDIGLPVEQLRQPIRSSIFGNLTNSEQVLLEAINRRGKSIQCHVTCTSLVDLQGQIQGVILLMEQRDGEL